MNSSDDRSWSDEFADEFAEIMHDLNSGAGYGGFEDGTDEDGTEVFTGEETGRIADPFDFLKRPNGGREFIEQVAVPAREFKEPDRVFVETKKVIDKTEYVLRRKAEEAEEALDPKPERVRKYANNASLEKVVYKKPKKEGNGFFARAAMALAATAAFSVYFGLRANAYYLSMDGRVKSGAACLFQSLLNDRLLWFDFPINASVFLSAAAFAAAALTAVFLVIWLEYDMHKQSRIGHEHGGARMGTARDFAKYRRDFMESDEQDMIFGVRDGKYMGLSLNNKKVNRSANVLVIGGTGTGKTFKYIKPNILQENCSMIITDPSGDIFRSFAPYLLTRGYNVYLFNASDPTLSNRYNPLLNVYDAFGEISERQVNILVDLYLKNAKAGREASTADPFWEKSEKAFLTALIYYVLENDDIKKEDKCFRTILEKVQLARVEDDGEDTPLTRELNEWYRRMDREGREYKTKMYYDTFLIAPQKTANTILISTAVDLQIFATKEIDRVTRYDTEHEEANINIDWIATQQSYLFLGIPQSHEAYNFLIAMLYSQLYSRLYELGERKMRGKWHIGRKVGTPVFDYFDSEEDARLFFETVTKDNIAEEDYVNGTKIYNLMWKGRCYKSSVLREPLEEMIDGIDGMYIWSGNDFAGGDPALPMHVNFLLDEFKNIGEIPNFLTILSTSRKYRIGSHVVIQDLGQIKTMYKEQEHETLLANVDTTIFLGSIQPDDKEYIQKVLSKSTIRQKSTSSSGTGISTSYTPTQVDLMSIDEISAINRDGRDDEIVIVRDVPAFICQKLNLTHHKRWEDVKRAEKLIKERKIDVAKYYKNDNMNNIFNP